MKYLTKEDIKFKKRKKDSKKGDAGKVLIIGGCEDYVGALTLAGIAALRAGCDWVTIAAPEKVAWAVNSLNPDLVTKKIKGEYFTKKHTKDMLKLSEDYDAIVMGMGIGLEKTTADFIKSYLKQNTKPIVLDAGALRVINLYNIKNAVLTPHYNEFKTLLRNSGLSEFNYTKALNNTVLLLKGPIDLIVSQTEIIANKTGNPGMAKAGTGDVLAGLVGGFLAQGYSKLQSACFAAYINGYFGDLLNKKKKGYFYIASDLVEDMKKIEKEFKK